MPEVIKVYRPIQSHRPWRVMDRRKRHPRVILFENVPEAVKAAMGESSKAYFNAEFVKGYWEIGERTKDQLW